MQDFFIPKIYYPYYYGSKTFLDKKYYTIRRLKNHVNDQFLSDLSDLFIRQNNLE